MKKIYSKIIIAIGLVWLILFVGCSKEYLNVKPIGTGNEDNMATKTGVNGLLIGAYTALKMTDGGYVHNCTNWLYSLYGGMEGIDNSGIVDYSVYQTRQMNSANCSINDHRWKLCYDGIQRANSVLRVLEKVPAGQITASEALQIKSEAIFLRAIFHFELAKIYLHVPYVDESVSFGAGNYNLPNTESIWPKIEADFQFAADNLDPTKTDKGRGNSWAAKCFLAKVYMQQHKYAQALPLLTDAINNGITAGGQKYDLNILFSDNWNGKKNNSAESVFAVQFTVNDNAEGQNGDFSYALLTPLVPGMEGGGWCGVALTTINTFKTDPVTGLPLLDTYNDFDIPNDQYIQDSDPFTPYAGTLDSRLDNSVMRRGIPLLDWGMPVSAWCWTKEISGPYQVKKYFFNKADMGTTTEWCGFISVTCDNYDMIRFADVLLLAAESEVEAGSLAKAEEYVNRVRARAADPDGWVKTYIDDNDPSKGFSSTPAANYKVGLYTGQFTAQGQDFARKAVRFERRLELAFEGHYFFDLQRWDNGTGYMADYINAVIDHENLQPAVAHPQLRDVRFTKGKDEIYPIPQSQIDASLVNGVPKLIQNPLYH